MIQREPISTMIASHDEHDFPDHGVEHRLEILGARKQKNEEHEDRQRSEDPARDSRLRREHVDEPAKLHASTDDLCHAVEDLCRVAAGLTL